MMKFPQYRRYLNGQSYFKISSPDTFTELKRSGNFFEVHELKAKILPDRNLIADLLNDYHSFAEAIDAAAFEQEWEYCHAHLKKLDFGD